MAANTTEVFGTDVNESALQDSSRRLSQFIAKCPFLEGQLIESVNLTSGSGTQDNSIGHSLRRPYSGFFVTLSNAAANVSESPTLNNSKSSSIILRTSSDVTVSLWVF